MKTSFKLAALVLVLGLSACTNADRFGNSSGQSAGSVANAAADPSSPAYFQTTVGDRVLFAVNESNLSDDARQVLVAQAAWLMANGAYTAIIEGHADEQGTREYNLALGARRASAVQEFLVSQGVAGNRLRTITYGKERPIAICSDESCYSQNRRAVTVLSAGAGS
jgi:peptidoglycan-associated lipoprotein